MDESARQELERKEVAIWFKVSSWGIRFYSKTIIGDKVWL